MHVCVRVKVGVGVWLGGFKCQVRSVELRAIKNM